MKKYILTLSIAVAVLTSAQAQTLQIDPIYVGGTATFEVQNGSPAALAILGYSLVGSGPYSLSNGLVLDLSMPIKTLNPMTLDSLGNGSIGPLPVPSNAIAGLQVWFQAVHIDLQANPSLTTTNMVPITLQIMHRHLRLTWCLSLVVHLRWVIMPAQGHQANTLSILLA